MNWEAQNSSFGSTLPAGKKTDEGPPLVGNMIADRPAQHGIAGLQGIQNGTLCDRAFDRQWALALLGVVLGRLRQEYVDAGRRANPLCLSRNVAGG